MVLPCGRSICEEHLNNQTKIECMSCRKEFALNEHSFVPNLVVGQVIKDENFLSDGEAITKNKNRQIAFGRISKALKKI